jgi:hypothetical protein
MAPFECFEARKTGTSGYKTLEGWLAIAQGPNLPPNPPAVVFAYRDCRASAANYPNSGEILAALLGRGNLQGYIAEISPPKLDALRYAWGGQKVEILAESWRRYLKCCSCPRPFDHPWLFSLDPMTFDPAADEKTDPPDDASLRSSDLDQLRPVFLSYLESGKPGAITIFCFSLVTEKAAKAMKRKATYEPYKRAICQLARVLKCHHDFCEVKAANPHVGAILSMDQALIDSVKKLWDMRHGDSR